MTTKPEEVGQPEEAKRERERSTIEFPYMGLEDAVTIAKGIHRTSGSSPCQHDQLAAAVGMSMSSSGYRMRLAAARMFGLIEYSASTGVRLTELGQMVADTAREREAKATAFLNVPLYKKIFEQNRGKQLPPPAGLEREMAGLGVAQKQTDRARQVFQRSAEVAGFFDMDKSRLIMPAGVVEAATVPVEDKKEFEKINGGGGGGSDLDLDPLLIALLKKIPPADTPWPAASRIRWFRTFAMNVSQIYDGDGEPVEMDIELVKVQPAA